ncbi:MAG TPA: D-alanyl-D-alanine carboxypeptidase family protein, partial [Thermoanaerobaculia bacterium]
MKRSLTRIALGLTILAGAVAAQAQPYTAAMVMEPSTRRVLFEKNAHQPLPVASMTKMMTLRVTLAALEDGTLTLNDPVTISARASKMGGSQVYLKQGDQFSLRDLIAATMVHSANDAAMALAEHVGGTADAFVRLMNDEARRLGLKESTFHSPHGLPGEGEPDDVMSAHDAAIIGIELMKDPLMRELAAKSEMPFKSGTFTTMYNPNHLLRNYPGATGIKTGFHNKAGFCVTASARRGNMDLVTVVMGSKVKRDCFASAAELLSENFATHRLVEPVRQGMALKQSAAVRGGRLASVPVVAGGTARLLVKRGEATDFETTVASSNLTAPVRKGQPVGHIIIKQRGKPIAKVPALAARILVEEHKAYVEALRRICS